MLLNSRILLQRSNLLIQLTLRHQPWRHTRQYALATNQNHLYFHHQIFKCNEDDHHDHAKAKTGLLLGYHAHCKNLLYQQTTNLFHISYKNFSTQKVNSSSNSKDTREKKDDEVNADNVEKKIEDEKSMGLVARFKKMTKEYWYVLIPVHVITSLFWGGGFYYASKTGVDFVGIMEYWNISETIINKLRDSHLGHAAVAYILYKIATPARYTVTLGGTTFAIKFLSKRGYIKPIPSRDQLVQMYKDKKDDLQQKVTDTKMQIHEKLKKDN